MKNRVFILSILLITVLGSVSMGQSLKADEIIAKHLDAIATKDLRDGVKNMFVTGLSEFQATNPVVKGGGKALVVSDPADLFFVLSLNSKEYPFEKIGFFSEKMSLPFVTAGMRSPLGAFLADHSKVLDNGLFMGAMSQRWNLLNSKKYGGKITPGGTSKIDGKKVYVLEYYPSDGASSEFTIHMYFDAETFNHVRTQYYHEIVGKNDVFGKLGTQAGVKLTLTEDFSDFRTIDGYTFPYNYKASYTTSSNSGLYQYVWGIKVAQYYVNQNLAPDFFTFDPK